MEPDNTLNVIQGSVSRSCRGSREWFVELGNEQLSTLRQRLGTEDDRRVQIEGAKGGMAKVAKRADARVGERIRERRTELGLTQEDLARKLNISYQQLQKYETGANRVSAGRLFEVAGILKTDVLFFYEGLESEAAAEPMEHGGKNRLAIELVRNFANLDDPELRSAISGLVKSLALSPEEPAPQQGAERQEQQAPSEEQKES